MEHVQVTDAVAIAVNEYGSNLTCVALEEELVFVDAGLLTWYASEFRVAMEDTHGKKSVHPPADPRSLRSLFRHEGVQ